MTRLGKRHRSAGLAAGRPRIKRSSNRLRAIAAASRSLAAGDVTEGYRQCQTILERWPEEPEAWFMLGMIDNHRGQFRSAIDPLTRATELDGSQAKYFETLGIALLNTGRTEVAAENFRSAIELDPTRAGSLYHLGNLKLSSGEFDEAKRCFERALDLRPSFVDARNNLGSVLLAMHRPEEAARCFERAIEMAPTRADVWCNLGTSKQVSGTPQEAENCFREAIRLEPDSGNIHYNAGCFFESQWQLSEAARHYRQAAGSDTEDKALNNLVNVLGGLGEYREAMEISKRMCPKGGANKSINISNLLMISHYDPESSPAELFELHRQWAGEISRSVSPLPGTRLDPTHGGVPLRVGYVSRDFREHSVAYFIEPVLTGHDPEKVAIYCYSDTETGDHVTKRLRARVPRWRDISNLTYEEVAERIRGDGIDILIDLGGHTGKNRLPVFAAKPAPIQATYLGYPDTTGLAEMDYRITDKVADPPGLTDHYHTEQLARLGSCFLCYRPDGEAPAPGPAPVEHNGYVTFGCFNNFPKLNRPLLAIWAKILDEVSRSRLMLKCPQFADRIVREKVFSFFEGSGIPRQRIELLSYVRSSAEHLALYDRLDIALDTYPYNGTTTTLEALWMGVPVITFAGATHMSRVGASILTELDKPELIAETGKEYCHKAMLLARNVERISDYRDTLREELQASGLMDAQRIASELESLYADWANRSKVST